MDYVALMNDHPSYPGVALSQLSNCLVIKSGISSFDVFRQRGKALLANTAPPREPPGSLLVNAPLDPKSILGLKT